MPSDELIILFTDVRKDGAGVMSSGWLGNPKSFSTVQCADIVIRCCHFTFYFADETDIFLL